MNKPVLYIDTDVGVDDIVAICMLIASNKFDIRGISVVNGVASVRRGAMNLTRIFKYIGISIPIYLGVNQKTQGSGVQFPSIDRKRAQSLALLPNIALPIPDNKFYTLQDLRSALTREKNKIKFLCLAPLSNFTILFKNELAKNKISGMTIMGGAINVPGNVAPKYLAEYNFRLDPLAADRVFKSRIPICLVPIDATKFVPAKNEPKEIQVNKTVQKFLPDLENCHPSRPEAKIIKDIIQNNQRDFDNFYDPLAAAVLLDRTLIQDAENLSIAISLNKNTFGKVKIVSGPKSIKIVKKVNSSQFIIRCYNWLNYEYLYQYRCLADH